MGLTRTRKVVEAKAGEEKGPAVTARKIDT